MSNNFIAKNTPSLDALVAAATSKDEDINVAFERMKSELHGALGMIVTPPSENDRLYSTMSEPVVAAPAPSVPRHAIRVVYPHLNDRFEIYGVDEADLDRQEAKIRSLYQ